MIEFYKDARNQWRWRVKALNGKILAISSESYKNKKDCRTALSSTRDLLREYHDIIGDR